MTTYYPAQFWDGASWQQISTPGGLGKNAYELAVDNGYEGTLEEWLISLNGNTPPAANVTVDTTPFTGNLDDNHDNVQAVAEAVDQLVAAGGSSTVQDEGVTLPTRAKLNFVGSAVGLQDDPDEDAVNVIVDAVAPSGIGLHTPIASGYINNYGTPGRIYYVPFTAPATGAFSSLTVKCTTSAPGSYMEIGFYRQVGSLLNRVKIIGPTIPLTSTNEATTKVTFPTVWDPADRGVLYYVGMVITGAAKVAGAYATTPSQFRGNNASAWPLYGAYTSLQATLPDQDIAPYNQTVIGDFPLFILECLP